MSKIPEEILQDGCKAYSEKFLNANGSFGEGIEAAYFAIHDHDDWVRAGPMEWNGEGLPPVGTVCEYLENGNGYWKPVRVVALDEDLRHGSAFIVFHGEYGYSADSRPELFRPVVLTPEQIKAEERLNSMLEMIRVEPAMTTCMAANLYDAGYRKV